jgi:HEAT repeat protein
LTYPRSAVKIRQKLNRTSTAGYMIGNASDVMTDVLDRPDTAELLSGLRNYATDAELRFDSLAIVFDRDLPWYAKLWCAVLIGKVATEPERAVEVLRRGMSHSESHVRVAVIGALGRVGGAHALELLKRTANDRNERGRVRNAAVKALGRIIGAGGPRSLP